MGYSLRSLTPQGNGHGPIWTNSPDAAYRRVF